MRESWKLEWNWTPIPLLYLYCTRVQGKQIWMKKKETNKSGYPHETFIFIFTFILWMFILKEQIYFFKHVYITYIYIHISFPFFMIKLLRCNKVVSRVKQTHITVPIAIAPNPKPNPIQFRPNDRPTPSIIQTHNIFDLVEKSWKWKMCVLILSYARIAIVCSCTQNVGVNHHTLTHE